MCLIFSRCRCGVFSGILDSAAPSVCPCGCCADCYSCKHCTYTKLSNLTLHLCTYFTQLIHSALHLWCELTKIKQCASHLWQHDSDVRQRRLHCMHDARQENAVDHHHYQCHRHCDHSTDGAPLRPCVFFGISVDKRLVHFCCWCHNCGKSPYTDPHCVPHYRVSRNHRDTRCIHWDALWTRFFTHLDAWVDRLSYDVDISVQLPSFSYAKSYSN